MADHSDPRPAPRRPIAAARSRLHRHDPGHPGAVPGRQRRHLRGRAGRASCGRCRSPSPSGWSRSTTPIPASAPSRPTTACPTTTTGGARPPRSKRSRVYRTSGSTIGGDGGAEAERVTSMQATPSFFRILRASPPPRPALHRRRRRGRPAREGAAQLRAVAAAVRRTGCRPSARRCGSTAWSSPSSASCRPTSASCPTRCSCGRPAAFTPDDRADDRRHSNSWQMLARLKPGATIGDGAAARSTPSTPATSTASRTSRRSSINAGFRTDVLGFHDDLVSESRATLWLLWAFAAFVLLIGALNVANLVSVRATAQVRELVTRLALGASLGSLTRQILTEALRADTRAGGALGLLLGWWALRAAPLLGPRRAAARRRNRPRRPGRRLHAGPGRRRRHARGDACRCCGCGTSTSPAPFAKRAARARPRVARSCCAVCWWPGRWRSRSCCWSAPACCWPASIASSPSIPASGPRACSPAASRCRRHATPTTTRCARPTTGCCRRCGPSPG